MTHDERIKAMAFALYANALADDYIDDVMAYYRKCASDALVAAGIEDMVREAAREAWDLGCMSETSDIEQRNQDAEDIVREVMGK